jgi:hypothetical protein
VVEWLCCIALLGDLINHTIILASALPLESSTSSHCFEYGEVPVGFRGMEYVETAKWLSLHILQVMAVPARSHLNSLQGFKQILWRFKGPHAGRVPPKEAIRVTIVLTVWATNVKTTGILCRPLPSIHVKAQQYEEHIHLPSYDSMA